MKPVPGQLRVIAGHVFAVEGGRVAKEGVLVDADGREVAEHCSAPLVLPGTARRWKPERLGGTVLAHRVRRLS